MKLANISPGDRLRGWFDTGAFGVTPIWYTCLRKGRTRVLVRCESGDVGWMYPAAFDAVEPPNSALDRVPPPADSPGVPPIADGKEPRS